jgi:CRISPR/Cas system-associated exonuclease Cas4 (RecB family)
MISIIIPPFFVFKESTMTDRPHWSYSAITQYLRCPLQYYFQRIARIKPLFTPSSLVLGSSIHEALALYHRSLQTQQPATKEQVQTSFLEAWKTRNTTETVQIDGKQNESAILEQGVAMLDAYFKEPPPEKILIVEQEFLAPLHTSGGEILEKPMTSIIDLVTENEQGLKITDLKTSSRSYSEYEAAISLQATVYANSIQENFGKLAAFEYLVLVKTKSPRVQRLVTTRTEKDLGRLGDLVQAVDRAIESETFYPIESPLNCSGCPFRNPCREWGNG